ncbi:hypothetical protein HYH03_000896 [Edaphochlamys debaryana]|uniref:Uncharacterized protein n=1 Tax=Edaphochlamys debaryana TaxID=47281 RepID=A0A835YDS9_9CHLO|nr:hypothetical protein HYH03_000896 [Edaphochlamys debaryana]|eukprot:KAG2501077.1 hypothetical protein HYH03_000896 [Edaphochlamys debaryana]
MGRERRLKLLKRIRVVSFALVSAGQVAMAAWRASQGRFMLAAYDAQLVATAVLWSLVSLAMLAVWRRQGGVSLLPSVLVSLVTVGFLMAADILHETTVDFVKEDRIVGMSLHTVLLGVLLFECMAEALFGHMASMPLSELEEPLFAQTEKEKAKEAEKRAGKGKRPASTRAQRTARAFRYVWPESRPLRLRLVACFVLVMGERCVNLAVPVLYKNMVDQLSSAASPEALANAAQGLMRAAAAAAAGTDGPVSADANGTLLAAAHGLIRAAQQLSFWSVFYPWVFAYLGFYFLRGGSGMEGLLANMRDLVWIPITQAAFRRISLDVFGHLLDLDHKFHLHRKTGQIMRILDRGTSSIQDTVSIVLFNVVPQLIDIVVACTYLALKLQPWAAVIVFITVASYVPLTVIITERRGVIRKRMNALDNAREGRATDMLLNYETVKYFCNEHFELNGYDSATRQYQAAEYWQMAFLAMLSITQASVVWFGLASGMVVCVRGVVRHTLTVGDAVLFVTMMNQLYVPLTFFGSYYRQVQKALIDMENMFELLDTEPSVRDAPAARQLAVSAGRLDFERVVFAYQPTAPPVLKGVSFTVPGHKTLAVVGATGSGKSTILRLLLRFYDPLSGRVLLDGQDIKTVTQDSLRRAVAVVPQDTVMFNDTVLYNIRYGRTDATDQEVHEAAGVAHIHNSIVTCFKKGYSTRVGERGLRLSGGEKQRVAFARAVLKRPHVLILDEATSALDSLTELAIQSSLQTLRSRCTTVIVAHRLSTIMDADLILVLDRGEVAQLGSHSELMDQGGLYAAMWTRQKDTAGYTTPVIGLSSGGASGVVGGAGGSGGVAGPSASINAPQRAATAPPAPPCSLDKTGLEAAANAAAADLGDITAAATTTIVDSTAGGASVVAAATVAAAAAAAGSASVPREHRVSFAHPSVNAIRPVPRVNFKPADGGVVVSANDVGVASPSGGGVRSTNTPTGGLPRVPSRLMRRAMMSDEMHDEGLEPIVSRNPTPRRARMVEDEENDRLYEDREPEEAPDTPGLASPDRTTADHDADVSPGKPPLPPGAGFALKGTRRSSIRRTSASSGGSRIGGDGVSGGGAPPAGAVAVTVAPEGGAAAVAAVLSPPPPAPPPPPPASPEPPLLDSITSVQGPDDFAAGGAHAPSPTDPPARSASQPHAHPTFHTTHHFLLQPTVPHPADSSPTTTTAQEPQPHAPNGAQDPPNGAPHAPPHGTLVQAAMLDTDALVPIPHARLPGSPSGNGGSLHLQHGPMGRHRAPDEEIPIPEPLESDPDGAEPVAEAEAAEVHPPLAVLHEGGHLERLGSGEARLVPELTPKSAAMAAAAAAVVAAAAAGEVLPPPPPADAAQKRQDGSNGTGAAAAAATVTVAAPPAVSGRLGRPPLPPHGSVSPLLGSPAGSSTSGAQSTPPVSFGSPVIHSGGLFASVPPPSRPHSGSSPTNGTASPVPEPASASSAEPAPADASASSAAESRAPHPFLHSHPASHPAPLTVPHSPPKFGSGGGSSPPSFSAGQSPPLSGTSGSWMGSDRRSLGRTLREVASRQLMAEHDEQERNLAHQRDLFLQSSKESGSPSSGAGLRAGRLSPGARLSAGAGVGTGAGTGAGAGSVGSPASTGPASPARAALAGVAAAAMAAAAGVAPSQHSPARGREAAAAAAAAATAGDWPQTPSGDVWSGASSGGGRRSPDYHPVEGMTIPPDDLV